MNVKKQRKNDIPLQQTLESDTLEAMDSFSTSLARPWFRMPSAAILGARSFMMQHFATRRSRIKGLILIAGLVTLVILMRATPLGDYLSQERISQLVQQAGVLAPLVFIPFYAVAVSCFVPGAVMALVGVTLFGTWGGFLYVWLGALLACVACFYIGRRMGREFVRSIAGETFLRYDEALVDHGFTTTLYMRLLQFPTTAMNYGMGLTAVRFRDYFLGSAIGMMVEVFAFTFIGGTVQQAWSTGDWSLLVSWRVFLVMFVFVFSFFIPKLIKRLKKRRGDARAEDSAEEEAG